jgi:hydroxypyruvate isomerase
MPRFSINISFLLTEHALLDRFAAAADLGFLGVEILFPYDDPPEILAEAARKAGVELVLHNLPAGNREAGEIGLTGLPGRQDEFRAGVERALAYTRALGNKRVHAPAGRQPEGETIERCHEVLVENLRYTADTFAPDGVTVLLEPINGRDVPGFLVQKTETALELLDRADRPNLALQFDIYHRQVMQGDLIPALERFMPRIGHIQFSDTPGRHEPGTGEIAFERVFAAIDRLGYRGWVGAEYAPSGRSEDSLGWFREWES